MADNMKTVMNKHLAEALIRAGMHHFDAGGTVLPQQTVQAPATTFTDNQTAGGVFGHTADPTGDIGSGTASAVNSVGGIFKGIGTAFTDQNGYQAQLAPTSSSDYTGAITGSYNNAAAGYGNAQNIQGQQEGLANTLYAQSQGQGPNPVQSALASNTGTNVANTAALIAGQRGASANPGLAARTAAQQGAATQQQAVGQAATLQGQQQLAAQQQLQQQQQNIAANNVSEQNANAGLYGTSVAGQNTQNANEITNYANAQGINSQVAQNNSNAVNKTEGGMLNGVGSLAALLSKGGVVGEDGYDKPAHLADIESIYHPKKFADGGAVATPSIPNLSNAAALAGSSGPSMPKMGGSGSGSGGGSGGDYVGSGATSGTVLAESGGGKIPGKAKVKGNSQKNDTVPALLSAGEVVIPRSVMESDDPASGAAKFVEALMKKKGGTKEHGEFKDALNRAIAGRKTK